jgi:glycosyltransferase involved in cell wall biosynthesis
MDAKPSISAIIPAYNSGEFLPDAVDSIRRQTLAVAEIIIVDDGSTDATAEIAARLGPGVVYLHQPNAGPSVARNTGIFAARSEWVAFLDADDRWTPEKLEQQWAVLARRPELALVASDMAETDAGGRILVESMLAKHRLRDFFAELDGRPVPRALARLLEKNFIPTGTVLARRGAVLAAGGFDARLRFGEDLELWCRIAARHPIACLPAVHMLRRRHGGNAVGRTEFLLRGLIRAMESLRESSAGALREAGRDPDRLVAEQWAGLGYFYFDRGRFAEARRALRRSLREKPNGRALFYLAACCFPADLVRLGRRCKQGVSRKPEGECGGGERISLSEGAAAMAKTLTPALAELGREAGASSLRESPRRVLYVENGMGYGGAVVCLRHLAGHLDRRRFAGRIVTGRTGPEYRSIAADAEWRHLPDRRVDTALLRRRLEALGGAAAWPGFRWFFLQAIARLDDFANFLPFCRDLWREIRAFDPHLIHANNEPLCNRAALLLGRLLGIPVVCHVRGPQDGSRMMRTLYRLPDRFIPVSHWIDRGLDGLGIPGRKRTVVYDGIDLGRLDPGADGMAFRHRFGVPREAFAVGLVGLLIPWKGQRLFLDVAGRLRREIPNLRMLLVGGTPADCGSYEAELRERVRRADLEDTVLLTGHVVDMVPAYAALDVVVSASVQPEPLGTVVIEAMAMGRALVAPDHGGGAEMNTHGETALLFRPGDAESLADCILALHRSPELRRRLGAAARERALRTFDIATHAARVMAVYEDVLVEE